MDTLVYPIADALKNCLCDALEAEPNPAPCFCGVVPGANVPADYCGCGSGGTKCGQAWVRVADIYPTGAFPAIDNTASSCAGALAVTFELGVIRCLPTLDANGRPPSMVDQANAARIQMDDWHAMNAAIRCCGALDAKNTVRGKYLPRSQGGCGGGALTVVTRVVRRPPRG